MARFVSTAAIDAPVLDSDTRLPLEPRDPSALDGLLAEWGVERQYADLIKQLARLSA